MASVKRDGDRVIIFDSSILSECTKEMFDPSWWERRGDILGHSSGRGKAWFVRGERFPMVLRRYRRGGMMARLLGDRFLGVFPESSRAFLEYALLERMISLGLPVPLLEAIQRQAGEEWAFPGRDGKRPKTRQAVWADVKRAQRAFRLPQNIGTHSARKVYAVKLLEKYGDIERVRRALNHSSTAVTSIYAMADLLLEKRRGASRRCEA